MLDFLKQEALGFPYWAWFAIILGIACILIAVIIIACVSKGKNKEEGEAISSSSGATAAEEKPAQVKEEKPEVKEEKPEVKEEEPEVKEEKPAAKVYHISKRKEDGKWQVKAEGATRALKLFQTQNEAIEYAKKVAGNQEGRIVIHKEGGGFRKLNY